MSRDPIRNELRGLDAWITREPDDWDEDEDEEPEEDAWPPEPCSLEARLAGCTCRMETVNSASEEPPEPRVDPDCPLHGWSNPDRAYDEMRDDGVPF